MENQTNDRVKIVLDYYNLGFNDIDRKLGLCRNTTRNVVLGVKEVRSKPSHDYIVAFLKEFSNVDANWFLFGVGEIFKPNKQMKEILEELDKLKAENDTLLSELQGSRFALSIVAKHSSFQQGNVAANFRIVSKKSPVNQQLIIKKTIVVNSLVNSVS
jgi:hypothetical protein